MCVCVCVKTDRNIYRLNFQTITLCDAFNLTIFAEKLPSLKLIKRTMDFFRSICETSAKRNSSFDRPQKATKITKSNTHLLKLLTLLSKSRTISLFFVTYYIIALQPLTTHGPYVPFARYSSFFRSNSLNAAIFTIRVRQSHPQAPFAPTLT